MYDWLLPIKQQLIARISQQKLHHGILLHGAANVGKAYLARQLVKALLCQNSQTPVCGECKACGLFEAQSHPDYIEVSSDKTQIGVDTIRSAIEKANKTAQLSGNQVILIQDADTLSLAGSNALLKTLEEPTPNTYIVMTTDHASRLLPTVLSRCEKQKIPTPSFAQSQSWLLAQGIEQVSESDLAAYEGSPIAYKDSLEHGDSLSFTMFKQDLQQAGQDRLFVSEMAEKWADQAVQVCQWLAQQQSHAYLKQSSEQSWQAYQACCQTLNRCRHAGVNKRLLLTQLILQLAEPAQ